MTLYSFQQLGFMAAAFDQEKRARLDGLHESLKRQFKNVTNDTMIPYVIDRAERAQLCSNEEAQALRQEFLSPDGMPLFINLD